MAIQQKKVTIEGDEYLLSSFPATKGIKYQKELGKVLLPAFAEMSKREGDKEVDAMGLVLEKLAENLDKLDENILKEMVIQGASKSGIVINFDYEFSADYGKLFALLKELIMFNFGSLFTVFGSEESPT